MPWIFNRKKTICSCRGMKIVGEPEIVRERHDDYI